MGQGHAYRTRPVTPAIARLTTTEIIARHVCSPARTRTAPHRQIWSLDNIISSLVMRQMLSGFSHPIQNCADSLTENAQVITDNCCSARDLDGNGCVVPFFLLCRDAFHLHCDLLFLGRTDLLVVNAFFLHMHQHFMLCRFPDDCNTGVPSGCSHKCAAVWLNFASQCSVWLSAQKQFQGLYAFTDKCEAEAYGTMYAAPKSRTVGRCNDLHYQAYIQS